MRFAYIDSQGNEVSIPSVDALALRIELGAIDEDTQLYDEQADYWGPASTHEIFHTLSRDQGEEGFVAPPPMAPPPPSAPKEAAAEPTPEAPPEPPAPEKPVFEPLAEEPVFQPLADDPPVETSGRLGAFGDDDALPVFDVSGEFDVSEEFESDDGGLGETDASDPVDIEDLQPEPFGASEEDTDFGGLHDTGFEATSLESEPMSFGGDSSATDPDGLPFLDSGNEDAASAPLPGLGGDDPGWVNQDRSLVSDDLGASDEMALFPEGGAASTPDVHRRPEPGLKLAERPEPKDRPSAPRRPRKKSGFGALAGVVVVVGVGGFVGWKAMSAVSSTPDPVEVDLGPPPVVIPYIPAHLEPTMRELADAAMADMIEEFRGVPRELDLRAEPNRDWLAGVYLATASRFGDVEEYWLGIERFLDRVREEDTRVFHDKYVARVERTGIAADTAAMLVERADSGFLATREARFDAYARMDNLVNAALDLHLFLSDNESEITYEPATGGISSDPVLEALPSNEALGDEMWGMVDAITEALDALESLEKVTTDRLATALLNRIRRAGVQ